MTATPDQQQQKKSQKRTLCHSYFLPSAHRHSANIGTVLISSILVFNRYFESLCPTVPHCYKPVQSPTPQKRTLISSTCTRHVKGITSNLKPRQQICLLPVCKQAAHTLQRFPTHELRAQVQAGPKLYSPRNGQSTLHRYHQLSTSLPVNC